MSRKLSPETRAKIAARQLGEGNSNWRGLAGNHWHSNLHKWLKRRLPKTGVCAQCGRVGKTDYACIVFAEGTGAPVYAYDPSHFGERCRGCNQRLDNYARKHWRKRVAA